uniref:Uncharacterized protein n=1 Tax=Neovison vison TaxID=452646 RepID=A0A8C7C1W7_NEOVI
GNRRRAGGQRGEGAAEDVTPSGTWRRERRGEGYGPGLCKGPEVVRPAGEGPLVACVQERFSVGRNLIKRPQLLVWTRRKAPPRPAQARSLLCFSYRRFSDCYKRLCQLQPDVTQRIHDKFVAQLQASVREEISEIKAEGNLEAVLDALDRIVEEGKDRTEPAWPCTENRRSCWACWGSPSEEAAAGPGTEGSRGQGPGPAAPENQ